MDAVRAADHDRYLSALYAPAGQAAALFALYAFNAEIASVRDRIHEPLPGEIRLQWWRDVIADGRGRGGHPLAEALLATIRRHDLPRETVRRHLEARIFDLYDDPMPGRTELEGYCGETASALIQLAALVLDAEDAPRSAEAGGPGRLRAGDRRADPADPAASRRGQCFVPRDVLAAAGTTPEAFVAGDDAASARRAVTAMIALAAEHLAKFERHAGAVAQSLRPALFHSR